MNETTDDGAMLAFRVNCTRCGHDAIVTFDDAEAYHRARRFGCPGCMGTETNSDGTETARDFPRGYRIHDRTVTSASYVDPIGDDFDDLPDGPLTDTQAADYWAVEVDGKTGGRRARERGVVRGTVTNNVARARRKIRGEA